MASFIKEGSYEIQKPSINSPPKVYNSKYPKASLNNVVSNIKGSNLVGSRIVPKRKNSLLNSSTKDFFNSANFRLQKPAFKKPNIFQRMLISRRNKKSKKKVKEALSHTFGDGKRLYDPNALYLGSKKKPKDKGYIDVVVGDDFIYGGYRKNNKKNTKKK